jgi:hypothetical protein
MTGTQHEDQPKQPNRINPIAIIAGALASLSAAVVASYFGVAGTLIGAAVVSVVSSLAAALYAGLIGRGQGLVQRTATTVLRTSPDRTGVDSAADRTRDHPSQGTTGAPTAAEARAPGGAPTLGETPALYEGGIRWPRRRSVVVVGAAVLIFAIAMGAVSGIEAAIKEPIATALGVRDKGQARTSVGVAVDRAGGSETTRPTSPPSSSTQAPPSSERQGQTRSTTEPGPPTTGGSQPLSTTLPPTTAQPASPSSSSGATSGN